MQLKREIWQRGARCSDKNATSANAISTKVASAKVAFANVTRIVAPRFRVLEAALLLSGVAISSAILVSPLRAQTASSSVASSATVSSASGFDFGAKKVTARTAGIRLDGNAFIKSPQLDARANTVAFDFEGKQITAVRANGGVILKMNLTPRGGGAAARIETKSDAATLDPVNRVLVLTGHVDGFYQLAGSGRNTLRGNKATISYAAAGQFSADVSGGTNGVQLTLPPAPPVAGTPVGTIPQLGAIVISAQNLSVDSVKSTAIFTGNARAISKDGLTKFDISGPSFVVTRDAQSGAMTNLRSTGRTLLKVNLPPQTVATPTPIPAPMPIMASSSAVGQPIYFEIASDAATLVGDEGGARLGTMTFEGNVSGFYRLQTPDGKTTDNRFTGDRAVVQSLGNGASAAENFQIEVTGAPVNIQTPFNLGF